LDFTMRQALAEQLAESLARPLPSLTPRRVFGRIGLPGKATAVTGMRRAGKTTFLHQLRRERVERGIARELLPRAARPGGGRHSVPARRPAADNPDR